MISVAASVSVGCSAHGDEGLREALEMASDKRRGELESLIEYNSETPLQRKGAEWIVANMPFNHTLRGPELERYLDFYHLFSVMGKRGIAMVDSLQKADGAFSAASLRADNDLTAMDLERMNDDIELAFRTRREMPWSVNVSEEDFIRYVLPYRIEDEHVSPWRIYARGLFSGVIDSLRDAGCADPLVAARALIKAWNRKAFQWTGQLPQGPALGMQNLTDKAGTCREFAHGVVYLMRAAGIPAGIDMVPVRGENSAGHSWPFIIGKGGATYVASTENPDFIPAAEFDIVAAKIYRKEFGLNRDIDRGLPADRASRPSTFALPKLSDVTAIYKPGASLDVEPEVADAGGETVYLASWGNNRWVAVDCSPAGERVRFRDVSGGVISVAAVMRNGRLEPVSAPFEMRCGEGKVRYIVPGKGRRILTAYAKFPLNARNGELAERCIGGVIEGADEPAFAHPDTIHVITALPKRRLNEIRFASPTAPHRYYRYVGPAGSHCNIAELALREAGGDGAALKGRLMGTRGAYDNDPAHDLDKVFDGDIFTSFDYKEGSGGWAGLDLGRPVSLEGLMYVPRNRDNYVRAGDDYELFWFGGCRWNSAGRKMAMSDSLDFEVPEGTLYYLRNYSRGRSERIFEYDFDRREQRFW